MRAAAVLMLCGLAVAGCSSTRTAQAPMTDRPLWAANVRSELRKPFDQGQRDRFKRTWGNHLSWEMPPYRPLREHWNDSWAAWGSAIRPRP